MTSDSQAEKRLGSIVLASGASLLLLALLSCASTTGALFGLAWLLHIALQVGACVCAAFVLRNLALRAGFGARGISLLAVASLACSLLLGLLPVTARDALIYHLAVPKLWLNAGRMIEIPWHEWSYFPMLLGPGYAGFLSFGLEQFTAAYHLSFAILSSCLIALLTQRLTESPRAALVSFLLSASLPLFFRLASEQMSDFAMTTFFLLSVLEIVDASESASTRWAPLRGGISLGLMLCCKYNSILAAVIVVPLSFVLFLTQGRSTSRTIAAVAVLALAAAATFAFWPIRNWIWTGNPLFPFLQSLFGQTGYSIAFVGPVTPLEHRTGVYGDSWLQILLIPLRFVFSGRDGDPAHFDGVLSPLLLVGLVPLFVRPRPKWLLFCYALCACYLASSIFLFHALVRYQAPVICLFTAFSAAGLRQLWLHNSRLVPSLTVLAILAHIVFCGQYAIRLLRDADAYPYLAGEVTKDGYLARHISDYPLIRFMNENLPAASRTLLLLTGNRFYYYDRDVRGGYFSADFVIRVLRERASGSALLEALRAEGITHLALHKQRMSKSLSAALNDSHKAAWNDFMANHTEALREDPQYWLGKLR